MTITAPPRTIEIHFTAIRAPRIVTVIKPDTIGAEQHDIGEEDNCGGNSESFIEGCKAYVREQQGMIADEDSDEPKETEPDEN